jgi:hypothetical protein
MWLLSEEQEGRKVDFRGKWSVETEVGRSRTEAFGFCECGTVGASTHSRKWGETMRTCPFDLFDNRTLTFSSFPSPFDESNSFSNDSTISAQSNPA